MPPNKRTKRRFRKRHLLLALVFAYVIYAFGSQYLTLRKLNAQYAALQSEKQSLLVEQSLLQSQYNYMLSNAFVELVARKELGLVKPGEKVIMSSKTGTVKILKKKTAPYEIGD